MNRIRAQLLSTAARIIPIRRSIDKAAAAIVAKLG